MSVGAAEREQGARRGASARLEGIDSARGDISQGYGKARNEIQPITELYGESKAYFDQYNTPGGLATLYQKFTSSTDPLYNYYDTKSSEQLNRELAARGKFGGGYSLESHAERVGKLGAEIAGLTEQRVQNELGLKERMMDRGISAKGNIAQLYQQEGSDLANLSLQEGAAKGAMHEGIGEARGAGKQGETAAMMSALAAVGGAVGGFMTGGLAGAVMGATGNPVTPSPTQSPTNNVSMPTVTSYIPLQNDKKPGGGGVTSRQTYTAPKPVNRAGIIDMNDPNYDYQFMMDVNNPWKFNPNSYNVSDYMVNSSMAKVGR